VSAGVGTGGDAGAGSVESTGEGAEGDVDRGADSTFVSSGVGTGGDTGAGSVGSTGEVRKRMWVEVRILMQH